ncbi:MAG: class I SAM-dependent methyltransferase [Oscillospiraceae bacterium]|jgi:SAM-dependent methyltransferase|nr:class I SAM-dependent methyltransferase [Oscillospiraceae bacterium]
MYRHPDIDNGCAFDWERASVDYAKYRDIYPASFYERLREFGIGLPGQHVLDLGTGTGVLPRAMAPAGARFTGVDISVEQIEQARALSAGLPIAYLVRPAEEIDFPPGTFDAATACQCFPYFDRAALLPKVHRALKPGGRFAILSMTWLVEESGVVAESERLVLKYNPNWTGGNFPKMLSLPVPRWAAPLFEVLPGALYCEDVPFSRAAWHGRMLACRGIGASNLSREQIAAFEAGHLAYLATLPECFTIPHQMMMVILKKQ